jgi:hypothetical protein
LYVFEAFFLGLVLEINFEGSPAASDTRFFFSVQGTHGRRSELREQRI